jgi:hypothetical protein
VFVVFATLAVNACVCEAPNATVVGVSDTVTAGLTLKVSEATELAIASSIATALRVPELVRAIGPE